MCKSAMYGIHWGSKVYCRHSCLLAWLRCSVVQVESVQEGVTECSGAAFEVLTETTGLSEVLARAPLAALD